MLIIKTIQCNPLQENCYVAHDEATLQAAIIDCGAWYDSEWRAIASYIAAEGLHPTLLLFTHGHFDHVAGCHYAAREYGLQPRLHEGDAFLAQDIDGQTRRIMGTALGVEFPAPGPWLSDGDTLQLGDTTLRILHTPGHSPGSVVIIDEADGIAFTGDTLFRQSVGRTDFDGGSWTQLMDSLAKIQATLPAATTLYPGHGPATTLASEQRSNPYLIV